MIIAYAKTKVQISCAVIAQLIRIFVFATWIVQFLCFINLKFQVFSHLLKLHKPVCVGPGRKPQRPIFSHRGLNMSSIVRKLFSADQHLDFPNRAASRENPFCLCENKDADQLCSNSNCTADQHLCFCYTESTTPLLLTSKIPSL